MSDIELFQKRFDEFRKDEDENLEELRRIFSKNVDHIRSFNSSILTIALALIGALLLVASEKASIIQHPALLLASIIFLFLDSILIVVVTDSVLINENSNLKRRIDFVKKTFQEIIKLLTEHLGRGTPFEEYLKIEFETAKTFSEQERNLDTQNFFSASFFLRLINYSFILSLILAGIALLPLSLNIIVW